jgi:MFS family permease
LNGGIAFLDKNKKPGIFYGYIIVAASVLMLFVMHGVGNTFGVFFKTLQADLGWSRSEISGASSLGSLLGGLFGILSGRLVDRLGPKIIIFVSGIILGIGYMLMSQLHSLWQIYLFMGVVISLGSCSGDISTLSTIARWFIGKRGMMSGIVKAGTGLGILVMPLVASWLLSSYGWREGYIIVGVVCIVWISLVSLLFRRDPGQMGLEPYGGHEAHHNGKSIEMGTSFSEGLHSKQFWMVSVTYFLVFYCANSVMTHIVPHASDIGLSTVASASIMSVIGASSIAGRLTMGTTGDRIGNRRALLVCFLVYITSLTWLQFAAVTWQLYVFALIYGFAHGGFFSLTSPLVAELFGTKSHGAIFGITLFFGSIGGAIGPVVTGLIFDLTDSYKIAFFILIGVCLTGFALAIFLNREKVKSKSVS